MSNQIRLSIKVTIFFTLFGVVCIGQKRHYGNYYNKWRYWGPMFVLKADSTFEYYERTNAGTVTVTEEATTGGELTTTTDSFIFTDSSYGTYTIINDTIFLKYATGEIQGDFNSYNIRPKKLYWQGKSLYFIHPQIGTVIKQKEYYMTWSKRTVPNLSKADETWLKDLNNNK